MSKMLKLIIITSLMLIGCSTILDETKCVVDKIVLTEGKNRYRYDCSNTIIVTMYSDSIFQIGDTIYVRIEK